MHRIVIAGFLLVLAGYAVFGQSTAQKPFVVQYVDGSVQVKLKGQTAWKTLKVKDQVPADASVKLAKGAMIELTLDKSVLSLIKEGTYDVAGLIAKVQTPGSGLGSTVIQKIAVLGGGGSAAGVRASGTAGGVRAAKGGVLPDWPGATVHWGLNGAYGEDVANSPKFWEEDELAIDQAVRAMTASKNHEPQYEKAIGILVESIENAWEDSDRYEMTYLLASAYSELGSNARAWKTISLVPDTHTREDWALEDAYYDFVIRKAQIQVDALLYEDALVTLKPLLEPTAKNEFGQAACLVAYHAYKGLDRPGAAADIKQKGLSIKLYVKDESNNSVPYETAIASILAGLE